MHNQRIKFVLFANTITQSHRACVSLYVQRYAYMRKFAVALIIYLFAGELLANEEVPLDLSSAIQKHLKLSSNEQVPKIQYAITDLNSDGINDAVVWLNDKKYCGSGGCNMQIYIGSNKGYKFVSNSTIVKLPIRVLESKSHNWKQLIVFTNGIGNVILSFNGNKYPSNPSLQPKATNAQVQSSNILISGQAP